MGNDFEGVAAEARRVVVSRGRKTDFTRRRLLAIELMRRDENPVVTAALMMGCSRLTAVRFVERVRQQGVESVFHGNHGRRRFGEAYERLREAVEGRRGVRLSSLDVVRWLAEHGYQAPAPRTVRWWMRVLLGITRRRSRRRK